MKNSIGWCNLTFNPVWGCLNHCDYCYARGIAKRFWKRMYMNEFSYQWKKHPDWVWTGDHLEGLRSFKPTWLEAQFNKKFPKKPQRIFVGSMSEIYYWGQEWMGRVIKKVKQYPQHTFMFLTQHPEVYARYLFPANCWLGATVTRNKPINKIRYVTINRIKFLSVEPLLEKIDIDNIDDFEPKWIIVGAETGNRKDKVIPNGSWVFNILDFCNRTNTPLFIKDNLVKYHSEFGGYKQFPTIKKL